MIDSDSELLLVNRGYQEAVDTRVCCISGALKARLSLKLPRALMRSRLDLWSNRHFIPFSENLFLFRE